ncbi:hypothetical protein [Microseira sp. BLCC-F43]|uniref:hypothetical protein n=1 Tax=Microseira sp. BLCC-F43 TaxID=3153602 RepID=UPI0035B88982
MKFSRLKVPRNRVSREPGFCRQSYKIQNWVTWISFGWRGAKAGDTGSAGVGY